MQNTRSFSWACELVKVCYHLGVREAVISPGSRNTSLTLALVYFPGIRCVSVIDERSAGFIALGMSKMTKRPTLLCCTSGTASANYYPAIIEAYQSSIPLIVVTADRPAHLQQVGASQTIQQKYLFGSYVLDFIQLPEAGIQDRNALPTETHNEIIRLFKLASTGGPVHMNAPFNKPFEPTIEQLNKYIQDSKALVFGKEESPSNPIPNLASHRLVRPELIETTID
jgi:2-succinyl-5-enolpyruvyl-6-hydroxy-3-cyclohexene-1-carboxylate synthase